MDKYSSLRLSDQARVKDDSARFGFPQTQKDYSAHCTDSTFAKSPFWPPLTEKDSARYSVSKKNSKTMSKKLSKRKERAERKGDKKEKKRKERKRKKKIEKKKKCKYKI